MPHIKHYLKIDTAPEKVYEAITEQKGLSSWWTEKTRAKAAEGALLEFRFGDEYEARMEILKLEPNKYVGWQCVYGHREWQGTKINFDIQTNNGATWLMFGHENWNDYTEFFALCNFNWAYYLESLKSYCEKGKGTPYKK